MKKRVLLVIAAFIALCALALVSLIGCGLGSKGYTEYDGLNTEYTKVHIYGVGCVEKEKTKLLSVGENGGLLIRYTDKYGDEFITTEFAFVKGTCPICKK
jgi:hypothetical protein